jgi:hypothetical protein
LPSEGIWTAPPTPAATAALSGRDDEFLRLAELVPLAGRHGFAVMAAHEASLDEWDVFESGYTSRYTRWLAQHESGHPEAQEVRQLIADQQERYFGGYRAVLGLAYLHLVAV